jgi:hypothetical protein
VLSEHLCHLIYPFALYPSSQTKCSL